MNRPIHGHADGRRLMLAIYNTRLERALDRLAYRCWVASDEREGHPLNLLGNLLDDTSNRIFWLRCRWRGCGR